LACARADFKRNETPQRWLRARRQAGAPGLDRPGDRRI